MANSNELTITNIGPIEALTLKIPTDGGVVCFRGRNGAGKSHALGAIDAALTHKGTAPLRDNSLRGQVVAHGITMTIGKSTRRAGEAEVHTLGDRLNIADLVDPGIQDPEKADAHRIRALVTLLGVKADPAIFYELLGGAERFDSIVPPTAAEQSDLIAMSGVVKRALESASRKAAGEATNASARADASRKAAELPEGIDPDQPTDARALQAELSNAIQTKTRLESETAAAKRTADAAEASRQQLERAKATYTGPSIEEAQSAATHADCVLTNTLQAVQAAEQRLRDAQASLRLAEQEKRAKADALKSAQHHAEMVATWTAQIDAAGKVQPPKPGDLVRARGAVDQIQEQIEHAALIRRARESLAHAEQFAADAETHKEEADKLRQAAHGVDDVLSGVVAKSGVPLKIEPVEGRMRLTLNTRRTEQTGHRTCFHELSDGERWRIALDIAIQAVGAGGELTVAQSAWEGLDGTNRRAIAEQVRAAGVLVYTAQADDGPLRAEVYHANGEAA